MYFFLVPPLTKRFFFSSISREACVICRHDKRQNKQPKISSKVNNFPFSLSVPKPAVEKFLFFSHVLKKQQIINQKITRKFLGALLESAVNPFAATDLQNFFLIFPHNIKISKLNLGYDRKLNTRFRVAICLVADS